MKFDIKFVGHVPDHEFEHFLWIAFVNGEPFQYKTGVGNCTPKIKQVEGDGWNKKPKNSISARKDQVAVWVSVPTEAEVLDCLRLDARSCEGSFDDFCDEFGYDRDSLKAFNTYQACADNRKKLKKALGKEFQTFMDAEPTT